MIFDKGGGGLANFWFFAAKGGRGGLDPTIFGWHNMWTAPYRMVALLSMLTKGINPNKFDKFDPDIWCLVTSY